MRRRHTIVCLSSQPWTDGMWTNKQHVMSRVAQQHDVVFVNFGAISAAPLVRAKAPRAREWLTPWRLLGEPHERQPQAGVTALDFFEPTAGLGRLPRHHSARIAVTYDFKVWLLGRWLEARGIRDAIVWVYHPGYGVPALARKLLVYDCVDEYSAFPEHSDHPDWIVAREAELCRTADLVAATSRALYESKRPLNPERTFLVHNVGDAEHFETARDPATQVPDDIAALPKPVVMFVGAVSGYKLNFAWLAKLAAARPSFSIAVIGPEGVGDADSDASSLRRDNIHLLGHRSYDQLPAYLKGADVAVIPYNDNRYTEHCFPIKFFEMLATGLPVVISPLPALSDYFDRVLVAESADAFVARCDEAVAHPDRGRDTRLALARDNSWSSRVSRLMQLVEQQLP